MTLEERVHELLLKQAEQDKLKAEIDQMKADLLAEMTTAGLTKVVTPEATATMTTKETIKYTDEPAIIKYLLDNGYNSYVETKVKTTALNKVLKTQTNLTESLNPLFTTAVSTELRIKKATVE